MFFEICKFCTYALMRLYQPNLRKYGCLERSRNVLKWTCALSYAQMTAVVWTEAVGCSARSKRSSQMITESGSRHTLKVVN